MLKREAEEAQRASAKASQPDIGRIYYDDVESGVMEEAQRTLGVVNAAATDALEVLAELNKKKELKLLSEQDYDFVYLEKKGRLYFNGNGSDELWGNANEGGLFAVLKGKPQITVEDFTLLA